MRSLKTWGVAARRSRPFQVVAAVVVLALVAGSIVLVTRSAGPPDNLKVPHVHYQSVPRPDRRYLAVCD